MARRTKEQAEATREHLLETAEALFCEKGVATTTVDDVARAAGLTRGAFYWHFKNKADVLEALYVRATSPSMELLDRLSADPGEDPLGSLAESAVQVLRRLATDARTQAIFEVMRRGFDGESELCQLTELEAAKKKRCATQLVTILEAAIRRGQLPSSLDPALAGAALNASVFGLMQTWLERRHFDLEAQASWLVELFFRGLRAAKLPTLAGAEQQPRADSVVA